VLDQTAFLTFSQGGRNRAGMDRGAPSQRGSPEAGLAMVMIKASGATDSGTFRIQAAPQSKGSMPMQAKASGSDRTTFKAFTLPAMESRSTFTV
jgi:hypothetical protein